MCLQDHYNIVRYCHPKTVVNGKITAVAFKLRTHRKSKPKPEGYLSVNWLEYFRCEIRLAISKISSILNRKLILHKDGKYAVVNVGDMIDYVKSNTMDKRALIVKRPKKFSLFDKSHYGIFGYSVNDNNNIPALIAFKIKRVFDI